MDEWLDDIGLYRKNTALDGSCLFRAVAEQLLPANPINGHLTLRKQTVAFMREHASLFAHKICADYEEYLATLSLSKGWGTVLELTAISLMYRVEFLAFLGPVQPIRVTGGEFQRELMLCITGDCYYDAIYTKAHVQNLGFAQSIVYKILYEDVFKLNDLDYAVNRMLHDKAARAQRERFLNQQCMARDEICFEEDPGSTVNVRKVLDSGAILFPYKVAKALDPDMYRNVDFDNWVDSQRGKPLLTHCLCSVPVTRRNNAWFGNGGPLRVGAKCHVRFEGQTLTGFIQDLSPDKGPALVFIEQLSQKMTIPYNDLIALPRTIPRPEWSYAHKHQMINKFVQQRGSKEESAEQRSGGRLRCRRGFREGSEDPSSPEQDSTVSSTTTSLRQTNHSLICTPDETWSLVDKFACFSTSDDFSDLPLDDKATLRFFYNMGIEYFHKGVYIIESPEEDALLQQDTASLAQACQGAPLIQPPPLCALPEPMPAMLMGPPPPLVASPPHLGPTVCSSVPLLQTLTPVHFTPVASCSPVMASVPMPSAPSPVPVEELPKVEECHTTPTREGRGRNRCPKAPRFMKSAALKAAQNQKQQEEIQDPEITSSFPEPAVLPVTMLSPVQVSGPPPYMYQQEPLEVLEPVSYTTEHHFPTGWLEHRPVMLDSDGNFSPCFIYPTPVYYN